MSLADALKHLPMSYRKNICRYRYDKVQRTTSRLDDFTTYDLTTFTTSRLVINLETGFRVQK
jgi:hypothetical protein